MEMKETPEIIYLVPDKEDPDYIVWQRDQPADSGDGVEYVRADLADASQPVKADGRKRCYNCGSTNLEYDGTCRDC